MLDADRIVKAFMRPHHKRLSQGDIVVIPSADCPLPDHTRDLSNNEWMMLCYLVTSPRFES
jgi:hypothetical protein